MLSPPARLAALRSLMAQHGLSAYWVPSEDAHQSEYTASWDNRRGWLSGFTGSAGFAMVTVEKAALWTDGRYFLQAEKQLDASCWQLMRAGLKETPSREEWLISQLHSTSGARVGVDGRLVGHEAAAKIAEQLAAKGLELELMTVNLVDECWGDERPPRLLQPIEVLPMKFAGREAADKLSWLRNQLTALSASGMLVTALDEVCCK